MPVMPANVTDEPRVAERDHEYASVTSDNFSDDRGLASYAIEKAAEGDKSVTIFLLRTALRVCSEAAREVCG